MRAAKVKVDDAKAEINEAEAKMDDAKAEMKDTTTVVFKAAVKTYDAATDLYATAADTYNGEVGVYLKLQKDFKECMAQVSLCNSEVYKSTRSKIQHCKFFNVY